MEDLVLLDEEGDFEDAHCFSNKAAWSIHFIDKAGLDKKYKLCRIRNIVDHFTIVFIHNYKMKQDISLDEI